MTRHPYDSGSAAVLRCGDRRLDLPGKRGAIPREAAPVPSEMERGLFRAWLRDEIEKVREAQKRRRNRKRKRNRTKARLH